MKSIDLLNQIIAQTHDIIRSINSEFGDLSSEVLCYKPNQDKWCINECFDHLNFSSEYYLDQFENALKKGQIGQNVNTELHKPGIIGNFIANSMKPNDKGEIKNKMKTFKSQDPSTNKKINPLAINDFLDYQNRFLAILEDMKYISIINLKVNSLVKYLNLKLPDALRVYTNHNERHLVQAINTKIEVLKKIN